MSTRRPGDDFEREIQAHIELETDRLRADGLSPEAARAAAQRRFGNVVAAQERYYESHRLLWLDRLRQDVRDARRSLRRTPVATLVAILSLAAGIGATTVTLTVRDIVFRRPPPTYHQPEQLSHVRVGTPANAIRPIGNEVPTALYARWHDALGSTIGGSISLGRQTVRVGDRRDDIGIRTVTPELFTVLGVEPILGTSFAKAADTSSLGHSAILSYRTWQQLFDERTDAIGQSIWVGDRAYTVIGVMPRRFWFSDMDSPIWTALDPARLPADRGLAAVVARRADGETPARFEARLQSSLAEYAAQLPEGQRQLFVRVSGVEGTPLGHQMSLVLPYVLGMATLLTLLISCANVAILLMARWTAREHEIAIRASIGASRGRIVRSLLTESVTIAACGALLGAGLTFALNIWVAQRAEGGGFFDLSVDWRIMSQAALIALGAGIFSGIVPALHETRRMDSNPLRWMAASDRVRQRWRHALVVLEITLTIALLVVTVSMIDGYLRISRTDLGYTPAPLMSVRVENPGGVPSARVVETLASIPGVAAAGASTAIPMASNGTQEAVRASRTSEPIVVERGEIDDRFFATLGVRMVAGRSFYQNESKKSGTAIVNQALADRLAAGGRALGARILGDTASYEVVGVVADYATNPWRAHSPTPRLFVPVAAASPGVRQMHFLVRAEGNPSQLLRRVRDAVGRLGGGTVVTNAETLTRVIDIMGQETLVGTAPLLPLVAIGVLLTTAGIYGVLTFAIARRSRELAVRVAVGASAADVVRLVAGHTLRLVAIGSFLGLLVMLGLAKAVRAGGGAGSIWDPSLMAFLLPIALVCSVAALAALVPSRRALAIDPVVLLRQQ